MSNFVDVTNFQKCYDLYINKQFEKSFNSKLFLFNFKYIIHKFKNNIFICNKNRFNENDLFINLNIIFDIIETPINICNIHIKTNIINSFLNNDSNWYIFTIKSSFNNKEKLFEINNKEKLLIFYFNNNKVIYHLDYIYKTEYEIDIQFDLHLEK